MTEHYRRIILDSPESWPRQREPVWVSDGDWAAIREHVPRNCDGNCTIQERHWRESYLIGTMGPRCEQFSEWTHWKSLVLPDPVEKPGSEWGACPTCFLSLNFCECP